MAETRSLIPLLNYALDEAIRLVGAERGYIVLLQADGSLDFRVKRGMGGEELEHAEDQISKSVLDQVFSTKQPLLLRDAMNDPRFYKAKSVAVLQLRSIMGAPLISRGDIIGAIYVENRSVRGRFSEENLSPLILFANQAAVSIENAALNDELEARVAARTRELELAMGQLEKSWVDAVEANRLRTVWSSNISHDLRAPLGIVTCALGELQMGDLSCLDAEQIDLIAKSLKAVDHTVKLIDNLFDLFNLETGGLILFPEVITLQDFMQDVYNVSLGLNWPATISFKLEIIPPLPQVLLDPLRIRQVLFNLLSNARKFTTQGSVTLYARFLADQDKVLIGVADTGEGIPLDKINQLFQRFHQLDNNAQRRRQGAGIGLAICHDLVKMHGGRIWVESIPGLGSDFMFTLPLDPSAPAGQEST